MGAQGGHTGAARRIGENYGDQMKMERSLCVLCQPDGGEVAPAELADDEISAVGKGVANVHGVVPALDIVFPVLLVFCHEGVRRRIVFGVVGHPCVYGRE